MYPFVRAYALMACSCAVVDSLMRVHVSPLASRKACSWVMPVSLAYAVICALVICLSASALVSMRNSSSVI